MKDGTVLLWKKPVETKGFTGFVCKCITFFTKSDFVHVAVISNGMMCESSVWKEGGKLAHGARMIWPVKADVYLEPIIDLTEKQSDYLDAYCIYTARKKRPYNVLKLLVLAIVYPTRWFWRLIHWVPFNREMRGEVCSVYVDDAFMFAGIDLFPRHMEGYTVPGDFINCIKLRKL